LNIVLLVHFTHLETITFPVDPLECVSYLFKHFVAVPLVIPGALVLDLSPGALAINVNFHVLLHRLGIAFTTGLSGAVGHEPDCKEFLILVKLD